jgi:MFS family permease
VVAPISYTAAGRVDPTGLGVAVARVNIFNYVGFVLGAAVIGAIAPVSDSNGLRLAFIVPTVLIVLIYAMAKGFDPKPVPGSRADTPVAERPTV